MIEPFSLYEKGMDLQNQDCGHMLDFLEETWITFDPSFPYSGTKSSCILLGSGFLMNTEKI